MALYVLPVLVDTLVRLFTRAQVLAVGSQKLDDLPLLLSGRGVRPIVTLVIWRAVMTRTLSPWSRIQWVRKFISQNR